MRLLIAAAEQYRANISRGREAAEAALMAARRAETILAGLQKSSGGRPNKHPQHSAAVSDYRKAIAAAQISERTAETWQEVAAVADDVFKEYLTPEDDEERIFPSIRGLLAHVFLVKSYEDEEKAEPEPQIKSRFRAWRKAKRPKDGSWADFWKDSEDANARRNLHAASSAAATSREVWEAASSIVEIGYKTLATKTHPDHQGGDGRQMATINLAVEQLREMVAAKREGF